MNRKVLILYTAHSIGSDRPFSDTKYQRCYETLYSLGKKMGIHFCRAPLAWYDATSNSFTKTWEYTNKKWRLSGPVQPDLIFDKTSGQSEKDPVRRRIISKYPFIDDPAFTRFANNKYLTSRLLPQYFKPYTKITNQGSFDRYLKSFSGARIVLKPEVGSGGKGVHILTVKEALAFTPTFPLIAQEFIDGSSGIPGITDTYHDLRLVFIGEELVYSYIRTPKNGSLLANIAQGGKMQIIPKDKLPKSIQPLIRSTQKLFSRFPQKTYTIDVLFDKVARPWIIEFNTMPGMFFPLAERVTMEAVYRRLILELKKSIPKQPSRPQKKSPIIGVVVFDSQYDNFKKPFSKKYLLEAYTEFFELAEDHQLKLYRADSRWYDDKQKLFRQAWELSRGKWKLTRLIQPDVIYDKAVTDEQSLSFKRTLQKKFPVLNHPLFSHHAGSKLLISQTFQKYTKPYYSVGSFAHLKKTLPHISGEFIVAKPERGNSGQGVFIGKKDALLQQKLSFPLLLQEFIDSGSGIPGVIKGLHDLRLIYSGETFLYSYYRVPKKGSLLANVAQGGKQTMVPKSKLPDSVWPIVHTIQRYYKKYSEKIYTIDLIFDNNKKPWIVELNTMPGLYPDESERPHIKKLYQAIIKTLKQSVR